MHPYSTKQHQIPVEVNDPGTHPLRGGRWRQSAKQLPVKHHGAMHFSVAHHETLVRGSYVPLALAATKLLLQIWVVHGAWCENKTARTQRDFRASYGQQRTSACQHVVRMKVLGTLAMYPWSFYIAIWSKAVKKKRPLGSAVLFVALKRIDADCSSPKWVMTFWDSIQYLRASLLPLLPGTNPQSQGIA